MYYECILSRVARDELVLARAHDDIIAAMMMMSSCTLGLSPRTPVRSFPVYHVWRMT